MKAPVSLTSFRPQKSLAIAIGVLAVVVLPFLSYYTVNEGERGILLRYGKIVKVAEPGLGFKIPFMESVEKISTRNQAVVYQGLQAYSRDQQPAQMTVSVSFHIKPSEAGAVYTTYNTIEALKDRLIVRQLPTQLENVFGQYTAISAVQDRTKLVQDLQNSPVRLQAVGIQAPDRHIPAKRAGAEPDGAVGVVALHGIYARRTVGLPAAHEPAAGAGANLDSKRGQGLNCHVGTSFPSKDHIYHHYTGSGRKRIVYFC